MSVYDELRPTRTRAAMRRARQFERWIRSPAIAAGKIFRSLPDDYDARVAVAAAPIIEASLALGARRESSSSACRRDSTK